MKINSSGGKLIFNTIGGEFYTININGRRLTKILAQHGRESIDISADGSFIIFEKLLEYKIKAFSSFGGGGTRVAKNLPLPQGGTIEH